MHSEFSPKRKRMEQHEILESEANESDDQASSSDTTSESYVSTNTPPETSLQESENESEDHAYVKSFFNKKLGPFSREYIHALVSDNKNQMDTVYGAHFDVDKLVIGHAPLDFDIQDNVLVNGIKYKGTRGLFELIFKKVPDDRIYTDADLQTYGQILKATNAYKRGYSAMQPVNGNRGYKYRSIISKLIFTSGSGMVPREMICNDNGVDYVHWDDPNEIVDRLRLLMASQEAGHTGHNNEIVSIIEELREVGLIV